MELYLQFGYGMMEHCRALLSSWNGGSVVLSPRDLTGRQLLSLGTELSRIPGAAVLVDPQFYLPHADHVKLRKHSYWPKDYETSVFWQGPPLIKLLRTLQGLNTVVGCQQFILPGLLSTSIDDDWCNAQMTILEEARAIDPGPLISTIALSSDVVQDAAQIALLLERAEAWKAPAYYVVCQPPKGEYLVTDPTWVANVLDLAAGLKLQGSRVILGYCSHQMLIAGSAKVDAIASGTWMNVRCFSPEKFNSSGDEDIRQTATWYYCPQALSEYKIPYLDIAWRLGVLQLMEPSAEVDGGYAAALFGGAQPTTASFGMQASFRHYLHSLHKQVSSLPQDSFESARAAHEATLQGAEALLARLRSANIRGQLRDFSDIVDVNRAALGLFSSLRGSILRRAWSSI